MMKNRFGKPFYPGKPNRTYALIGGAVFLYMIFVTGFRKSPDCTTQASAGGGKYAVNSAIVTNAFNAKDSLVSHDKTVKELEAAGWEMIAIYRGNSTDPNLKEGPMVWASQAGQDRSVYDIFKKEGGYFVDLAANDGYEISNTWTLEKHYKWKGLCIEPNPVYEKTFLHRKCQLIKAAVGKFDNETVKFDFTKFYDGGIIGKEFDNKNENGNAVTMQTVTLRKMFKDFSVPSTIDYLCLDIEGAEWYAFQDFPFDEYKFLTLTVERPKQELVDLLADNGYIYMCNHGGFGDQLWIHESIPNKEAVMKKYGHKGQCIGK